MTDDAIPIRDWHRLTVRSALAQAERRLTAIPGEPRIDAERLMAAALGVSIPDLRLHFLDERCPAATFARMVLRRLRREPVPYITRRAGFWSIELVVGPGVLIPRADSETLIEAAKEHFGSRSPSTVLDLGTGPGTLLLAALTEWPEAQGLGIDSGNIWYAMINSGELGLRPRCQFLRGNWAKGIDEQFELVLCNPPYIPEGAVLPPDVVDWEPPAALFAGEDGLDAYRALAPQVPSLLAPGGIACFEIGADQAEAAGALFAAEGLSVAVRKDLAGRDRCLVLRR